MTDRAVLMSEIETLPESRVAEALDFVAYLKWKSAPDAPGTTDRDTPEAPPRSATPITDSLLGIAASLGDISLEEIREERLSKYLK